MPLAVVPEQFANRPAGDAQPDVPAGHINVNITDPAAFDGLVQSVVPEIRLGRAAEQVQGLNPRPTQPLKRTKGHITPIGMRPDDDGEPAQAVIMDQGRQFVFPVALPDRAPKWGAKVFAGVRAKTHLKKLGIDMGCTPFVPVFGIPGPCENAINQNEYGPFHGFNPLMVHRPAEIRALSAGASSRPRTSHAYHEKDRHELLPKE